MNILTTPAENVPGNRIIAAGYINTQQLWICELYHAGIRVQICNYGATIMSVILPDRNGVPLNIVAGFSLPQHYLGVHPYFGSTVGRFANRIANARFEIDGKVYQLSANEPPNHLHGGVQGLDKKVWRIESRYADADRTAITLGYDSPDGEEGYPGNVNLSVTYTLTANKELQVSYTAVTDKSTILNLTNHSYFNLSGFSSDTIAGHTLQVLAEAYAAKEAGGIPTGEILPVAGTSLDFRQPRIIGEVLGDFPADRGLDHYWLLQGAAGELLPMATLADASSGICMQVHTNQPGCQIYTANFWDGTITGEQGVRYNKHGAIAIETQNIPDAPNHAHFPSALLEPGDVYSAVTSFRFSYL
ncbi:aldose 1-epimerase [Filimonas lacunae]|uniref:Aldose 1-epimerase n=1 Tax=Filimonas lacunae TaxID=477680 RepID=A0A173MGX2_9BACT|nr:aldose epimerase family protein [Filimonas lacunae]BAV06668.1 aldose 1-epimerase [Filimonas lacunae]SIT27832.1 aldose 1-epimerase [Filimonas lacunae]